MLQEAAFPRSTLIRDHVPPALERFDSRIDARNGRLDGSTARLALELR